MPQPPAPLYTLPEVAKLLGVNPSTVRLWVSQGRLEAHKQGRVWLVRREIVDAMVASGTKPRRYIQIEPEPDIDLGPGDPRRPDRRVSRAIEPN